NQDLRRAALRDGEQEAAAHEKPPVEAHQRLASQARICAGMASRFARLSVHSSQSSRRLTSAMKPAPRLATVATSGMRPASTRRMAVVLPAPGTAVSNRCVFIPGLNLVWFGS